MLHVGQRVVLIDSLNWNFVHEVNRIAATLPEKGVIYTVKTMGFGTNGAPGVSLVEVGNSHTPHSRGGYGDLMFLARRFRPLITNSQSEDTEMFQKLLSPTHKEKV